MKPEAMLDIIRAHPELMASGVLSSRAEGERYSTIVEALGLTGHHDAQKNWDTLKSFSILLEHLGTGEAVLDAGSSGNSAILRWLHNTGFQQLHACDVRSKGHNYVLTDVHFSEQDITRTTYADGSFSAVTCISVIEHGVPLAPFFREMARVLKDGGWLLVSTDYWDAGVDTSGIYPYGEAFGEMHVFTREELVELQRLAESCGFECPPSFDPTCRERAVRWERVDRDYTFVFLAFRKRAPRD